jgi:hypothetical protein
MFRVPRSYDASEILVLVSATFFAVGGLSIYFIYAF